MSNNIKNFDILGISKSIIHNFLSYPLFILHYFDNSTKLFAGLDLENFLNISAKPLFRIETLKLKTFSVI